MKLRKADNLLKHMKRAITAGGALGVDFCYRAAVCVKNVLRTSVCVRRVDVIASEELYVAAIWKLGLP